MVQHVHHVGAADARRVVEAGMLEAARLEVDDAFGGVLLHVFLGAEDDGAGGAGLHAGRLQPDRNPVGAEGALVGLVVLLRDARDVEGAAGDAVAAADALVLVEVDDAVGVLDDGAGARAGRQAARVVAVHAAVLADQPLQLARLGLVLGEAHEGPGIGREVRRVVVGAVVLADLVTQVVPFRARHLAGLAADALGHVYEFRHFVHLAHRGHRRRGGGAGDDVL
ncbi:hypothetical protein D9M69_459980 [compost metagenome]